MNVNVKCGGICICICEFATLILHILGVGMTRRCYQAQFEGFLKIPSLALSKADGELTSNLPFFLPPLHLPTSPPLHHLELRHLKVSSNWISTCIVIGTLLLWPAVKAEEDVPLMRFIFCYMRSSPFFLFLSFCFACYC